MAQGMDDVDEVRTSRQLDTVLETVGMDCNPGYVVGAPEMRDPMRCFFFRRHSHYVRGDR